MTPDSTVERSVDGRRLAVSSVRALAVVAAAFLFANIGSVIVVSLLGIESFEAIQSDPLLYTVVNGASFVGFIVAAAAYMSYRNDWDLLHVRAPRLRDVGYVVGGLVALAVASMVMAVVVSALLELANSLFGFDTEMGQNSVITTGRDNPRMFLYMIPVAVLLVGPGEELIFRGVVQGLFRRVLGVAPAIVLASLLFGVGHYFAISTGNAWTYIFVAGAMGLVLGGIYEYTENIAVPAAIHGLWNAAIFALNWYVATTGVSIPGA